MAAGESGIIVPLTLCDPGSCGLGEQGERQQGIRSRLQLLLPLHGYKFCSNASNIRNRTR
jgi:hypothetical protein